MSEHSLALGAAQAPRFVGRDELRRLGLDRRGLERALTSGAIIRARKGRYVRGDVPDDVLRAAQLGGRLDCVSLLRHCGVFVLTERALHLQIDVGASRLPTRAPGVIAHWRESRAGKQDLLADHVEALVRAVRCQGAREAVATLDSAVHRGFIREDELRLVFELLPRRYRALEPLVDGRCESGSESLMRLILRTLSCRVELQVAIAAVGRVDFLVDGWLIIECDSREFHSTWEAHKRDRRRDLAAAALGYTTVRILAEDIFSARERVRTALVAALAHGPRPCRGPR